MVYESDFYTTRRLQDITRCVIPLNVAVEPNNNIPILISLLAKVEAANPIQGPSIAPTPLQNALVARPKEVPQDTLIPPNAARATPAMDPEDIILAIARRQPEDCQAEPLIAITLIAFKNRFAINDACCCNLINEFLFDNAR